jgi:DNA-binding response OmpR family regulator
VHIRSIRKKLEEERERIETVRGVGYRFRDDRG